MENEPTFEEPKDIGETKAYVTWGLIICSILAAIFVSAFVYTHIYQNQASTITNPITPIVLNDILVDGIRHELPIVMSENSSTSPILEEGNLDEALYVPFAETTRNGDTKSESTEETPATKIDNSYTEQTTENNTSDTAPAGFTAENESDSIKIVDASVTNTTHSGELEQVTRTGVVRSVDTKQNIFIMGEGPNVFRVLVTNDTTFSIDNQNISFSALKINDIVEVHGFAYAESNEIEADTVTITGTFMLQSPS